MVILSQLIYNVLLAQSTCGFASSRQEWSRKLAAVHTQIESSNDGGAGTWRSIAKDFQNRPKELLDGDDASPKRLNIAFVVSYSHVSTRFLFFSLSQLCYLPADGECDETTGDKYDPFKERGDLSRW
jgi:hypothetical protein